MSHIKVTWESIAHTPVKSEMKRSLEGGALVIHQGNLGERSTHTPVKSEMKRSLEGGALVPHQGNLGERSTHTCQE